MTVLDSSVLVDYLLDGRHAETVANGLKGPEAASAPEVVVFEVVAALRRLVIRGVTTADRGRAAVEDMRDLPLSLYPSGPLALRAWDLRSNFSVGDAMFLALAEAQGTRLLTADARMARATAVHSTVEVDLLDLP